MVWWKAGAVQRKGVVALRMAEVWPKADALWSVPALADGSQLAVRNPHRGARRALSAVWVSAAQAYPEQQWALQGVAVPLVLAERRALVSRNPKQSLVWWVRVALATVAVPPCAPRLPREEPAEARAVADLQARLGGEYRLTRSAAVAALTAAMGSR